MNIPNLKRNHHILLSILFLLLLILDVSLGVIILKNEERTAALVLTKQRTLHEIELLKKLSVQLPQDEYQDFFIEMINLSEETTSIDIAYCTPEPLVSAIEFGKPIKIINSGEGYHTIIFTGADRFALRGGESVEINLELFKKPGLYGFGCDSNPHAVGAVLIKEDPAKIDYNDIYTRP